MTLRARIEGLFETSGMTAAAARFGQGLGLWILVGGSMLRGAPPVGAPAGGRRRR